MSSPQRRELRMPHPDDQAMYDALARANGGCYPDDEEQFAAALQKVGRGDEALSTRFLARAQIRAALRQPLLDTVGFGGRRGPGVTAIPLTKTAGAGGASSEDVEAVAAALDRLSGRVLKISREDI